MNLCMPDLFLLLLVCGLSLQDNKSDVKALLARFQTAGVSMEGSAAARPKPAVHPTLSGPMVPSRKPALEVSLSGGATGPASSSNPKPSYVKNIVSNSSASESWDSSKPKALAGRFENANVNEDNRPPFAKPLKPKPPDSNQNGDLKIKFPLQKPVITEGKHPFPKPPPVTSKPFKSSKPENNESTSTPPKIPAAPKPKSAISVLLQQVEDDKVEDSTAKSVSHLNVKPSSFRAAQTLFGKVEEATKDESKPQSSKESPVPGPMVARKKLSYKGKPETAINDPSAPKRNPLTNLLALGSAPSKPNRPPKVNLEKFKKGVEPPSEGECSTELYMSV